MANEIENRKHILDNCTTIGGESPNIPCIFPFKFDQVTYNSCTYKSASDGKPWCSTKVDKNGSHISKKGFWGHCSINCPIASIGIADIINLQITS